VMSAKDLQIIFPFVFTSHMCEDNAGIYTTLD
jgi:hypothetical protein